jgi:hypothetical protein
VVLFKETSPLIELKGAFLTKNGGLLLTAFLLSVFEYETANV